MNENLPFVIPRNQSARSTKGGGKGYKYFGDPQNFETHRSKRSQEIKKVTQEIKAEQPKIPNPQQLSFLDIKLDSKATASSSIPEELFIDFGLDINKRIESDEIVVSGTQKSLKKFEEAISTFTYTPVEDDPRNFKNKEAALLSSIDHISKVSSEQKLDGVIEKDNLGVAYFYQSISEVNAKKILTELVQSRGIEARYIVSPSGAKVIAGKFSKEDVELIVNDDYENPFAKFEVMHHVGVITTSVNATYPMNDVDLVDESGDVVVGVVDGGVADLKVFNDLIVDRKDYTADSNTDKHHGTLAASRVIFGHDIEDQLFDTNKLVAHAKVVDIKVMEGDEGPMPYELISYLEDAIKTFPYVKIFSMSLGMNDMCQGNKKSYLTRELDALQQKYKVVFVVSAGNRNDFHTRQYPDLLLEDLNRITDPADTTNGFSVGALADKVNKDALALSNEPSPFSRTGQGEIRKPDFVHYGGNARANGVWRDLGVKGFDVKDDELYENVGTSFSAPVVSGELAKAMKVVKASGYDNSVDLTKALAVHSASYEPNEASSIDERELDRIVGHGIPDVSKVLFADPTKVVYIITDQVGGIKAKSKSREAVRKIAFTIPEELKNLKRQLNVRATLAYTTPISPNDETNTAEVDVTMTLHKVNSAKKLANSGNSDDSDWSYKPKWYTVKSLERTYSHRSYGSGEWEVWLTLQTRGDSKFDSYEQPFALVVSIEDIGDDEGRIDLQQTIQNQHKQYVRINQIRNRQRVGSSPSPI